MDKFLIRKDVYDELIEKGYGKDLSRLTKKQITDKNGHKRTVYVKNGEQPAQQQPKAQNEFTPEKRAKYEDMLKQVMAGSDENALFVRGKGMLNKKDAIAHLENKLGKKSEPQSIKQPETTQKKEESKDVDFQKWLEDNDIVPEEMADDSHAQVYKKVKKTGLDDDAAMKITDDIMAYNLAYKSEQFKQEKDNNETKNSVNGFTLDDIYHHGSGKQWDEVKKIDDMNTAKGVVEMIAKKYGATDKGREQLMDFIAYNIGGTNPLYDKLYEEYGVDADDLDMDFEASHDLILNQAMGKDTQKNREQIADSKSDFERRYREMLEREG